MTAEFEGLGDCVHCRSAGSVRARRCQICDWEAGAIVRAQDADRGEGTITTASG